LFFAGLCSFMPAQDFDLQIVNERELPLKKINYKKHHSSKSSAFRELNNIVMYFQSKGYLLAKADTSERNSNSLSVTIDPGGQLKWAKLKMGNLNPSLASKIGFSEKLYLQKPFSGKQVSQLKERIITYYENNGYPFASVRLDSVSIDNDVLSAVLDVKKDHFFKLDSIVVVGNAKLNSRFLQKYISVYPGKAYNEQAIRGMSQRLIQLPFISQTRAPEVRLTDRMNKVYLFLDKKKATQLDGIIGVQPNTTTGKTVLTGNVKIKLLNEILHNGETFDLEWRRLQAQTVDFKGKLIYPYMFGSSFGSDYSIKIYKRDTSFIDINNDLGLQYYFSGLNYIKLGVKQRTSNIISTYGLANVTVLPEYADVSTQLNGFGVFYEDLDYKFNPHRGISITMNASAGNKKVRKNPKINDAAYANITLSSAQYMYDANISGYLDLGKNNVLKLGLQSASIFGTAPLFSNELIRIGGLRTLRGFDEESIFTSFYTIGTIEYRFLFAQNSNIIVFTEGAFYEKNGFNSYIHDTPISVGTGINFETKAGILSINYALGNQFGNGFDARNGKIHFGLTALF
jgi:translocation and assembly module TamA